MKRSKLGVLLCALSIVLAACMPTSNLAPSQDDSVPRGKYDPPRIVSDFTLTNHDGQPMKLSGLRGKAVLMFFGYTHCPDVCPLTLARMKSVKDALGNAADGVAFVMVSLDGARYTPEVMRKYVQSFDPSFIGLTGHEVRVRQIAKDYFLQFNQQEVTVTATPSNNTHEQTHDPSYLVMHTSYLYLLNRQGRWSIVYTAQTPTEIIAKDIQQVLSE